MQLHRDQSDNINIIRGMDDACIVVGEQKHAMPCIVTISEIHHSQQPASTGAGCIGNIRDQSDRRECSQLETGQIRARISDVESRSEALRGYL